MSRDAALAVFLAAIAVATAEVAHTRVCASESQDACKVTELRVNPCSRNPCVLKKGRNASMEFDFTPHFDATKMQTAVYWADDPSQVPFGSVGIANGCDYSTCPVVSGTPNKLSYTLYIGKKLPQGSYWFRWKLWNEEKPTDLCCFETHVTLRK